MDVATDIFNPFPGLRSFEEDEEYLFFGRERQVDELLKKLAATRFLAVVGASGSGKSSLVKSGLLPSLHGGYMVTAGFNWRIALFRPGSDPIGNMAKALTETGVLYDNADDEIPYAPLVETTLRRSKKGLVDAARMSDLAPRDNLLILVDQFEELFRFSRFEKASDDGTRDAVAFINLLLTAAEQKDLPIYVVFTMRSDFLGDCTEFRGLPEAINKGQFLIPRMRREDRREAITGPIAVGGGTITSRLVTRLLNDVGENPDMLPILQHALMRTWNFWAEHGDPDDPLDIRHYEAIGTMAGALSKHAEEAYAELETEPLKLLCEKLFKALTDKAADARGTRRPTKVSEIIQLTEHKKEDVYAVVDVFRAAGRSFLMPSISQSIDEDSIIDISHESLMRVWGRLLRWVEEEGQSAELYMRLAEGAALYQEGKTGLWRNPELELALKWRQENQINKIWALRYDTTYDRAMHFLDYSHDQFKLEVARAERKRKRELRRARLFALFMGTASIVAILFFISALVKSFEAEKERINADQKALNAQWQTVVGRWQALQASKQEFYAQQNRMEALRQQNVAKRNAISAVRERKKAEVLKVRAEYLQGEAERNLVVADTATARATRSLKVAERLRQLASCRTIANTAIKKHQQDSVQLASLLARQAYLINEANNGPDFEPMIYQALATVADDSPDFDKNVLKDGARSILLNEKGDKLISGGENGNVLIWNTNDALADPVVLRRQEGPYWSIRDVIFGATENEIYTADVDGRITHWDLNTRAYLTWKAPGGVNALALSEDGKRFYAGCQDGTLRVFNVSAGLTATAISSGGTLNSGTVIGPTGLKSIRAMKISDDGKSLALGTQSGQVIVLGLDNSANYKTIYRNQSHPKIYTISFNRTGTLLAAGGTDGNVTLHDLTNLSKDPVVLPGHLSTVSSVTFGKDDKLLATAGMDKRIRLWNLDNLEDEVVELSGHKSWIWSLAFSKDGTTLYSSGGHEDYKVRSWIVDAKVLAQKVCDDATRCLLTTGEWERYVALGSDMPRDTTTCIKPGCND